MIKELEKKLETEIFGFSYGEFDRHGEFFSLRYNPNSNWTTITLNLPFIK